MGSKMEVQIPSAHNSFTGHTEEYETGSQPLLKRQA